MPPRKCLQIGRSFIIVSAVMSTNKVLVATINKSKAVSPEAIYNHIYTQIVLFPLSILLLINGVGFFPEEYVVFLVCY